MRQNADFVVMAAIL